MCIAIAGTALGLTGVCDRAVLAQDAFASVETEMESGPQDVPGREKGERSTLELKREATPPAKPVTPEPLDWFGGKPWWEWSAATGNWGGARSWFDDHGFAFAGSLTLDWSSVWDGGVRNVASTRTLTDFNLTIDTQKFLGLEGGTFFIDFYSTDGRGGSADAGDFQGFSNIQTDANLDQIAEVWYEQWILGKLLRVKVGKVDANSEFAFVDVAGTFLNSSAGVSPPIFNLTTYPDPAMSVNIFVYPTKNVYLGFGLYDGATADGIRTGGRGPATFFSDSKSSSWFFIGEAGVTWESLGSLGGGRVAAGGWGHTARYDRFDGDTQDGTEGFFAMAEQQLINGGGEEGDDERGLFCFARYAWADEDVSEACQHVGGGFVQRGTFGDRRDDEAGVFVSWVDLSDDENAGFAQDETTVELYYRIAITPFFAITPDLQYIVNPSGDRDIDDSIVGSLRFELAF